MSNSSTINVVHFELNKNLILYKASQNSNELVD